MGTGTIPQELKMKIQNDMKGPEKVPQDVELGLPSKDERFWITSSQPDHKERSL